VHHSPGEKRLGRQGLMEIYPKANKSVNYALLGVLAVNCFVFQMLTAREKIFAHTGKPDRADTVPREM